jgi:hypothetical protein
MMMGADHNFFNTEWTPGVATAPASDDWRAESDPVCGTSAPDRLSAAEQYAAGTAYIAGFFRLVQGGEESLLPLFDGSGGATPSAGRAVVHAVVQAPAKNRLDVASFATASPAVRVSGSAAASICASMLDRSPQSGLPACASRLTTSQAPSWTPATYAGNVTATPVLRFGWSDPTGQVSVSVPKRKLDDHDVLTFRAALDEDTTAADLAVSLVDDRGRSATVDVSDVSDALTPFPGAASPLPKTWLRTVRIPLSSLRGIDTRDIREIKLKGASPTGGVYLGDLAFSGVEVGRAGLDELPRVSIEGVTVPEGDGPGAATLRLTLSKQVKEPVTVNVQSIASGTAPVITPLAQQVVIPARATSVTFTVPVTGNTTLATAPQSYQVVASVPANAVIGNGFARLVVTDDEAV